MNFEYFDRKWTEIGLKSRMSHADNTSHATEHIQLDKKTDDMEISFQGANGVKTSGQKNANSSRMWKLPFYP